MDADRLATEERKPFNGIVRDLKEQDLGPLLPILAAWIKDRNTGQPLPDEVRETMQGMLDSIEGKNDKKYIVAETVEGEVIGVIGYKTPDPRMIKFTTTPKPAELVNAYVKVDERLGKGVGRALVAKLEEKAKSEGYTEIILNSGPRYKETGWGFYDKLPGYKRVAIAENYYGEDGDAPVWQKIL